MLENSTVEINDNDNDNVLFSSYVTLHLILNSQILVAFLVFFLLVSQQVASWELREPIGFLGSSQYNLSYGEKAGNYKVRITTIIKGLKNDSNNYSSNQMTY